MSFRFPLRTMALSICFVLSGSTLASGAVKRSPLTAEDIANIRWVTSPSLTPDGKTVAYIVLEWDKTGAGKAKRKRSLWLASTEAKAPPKVVAPKHQDVRAPKWSPDGRHLAFLSTGAQGNGTGQIHFLTKDQSVRCLTHSAEAIQSFQWSPNSRLIAFLAQEPEEQGKHKALKPIEVGQPSKPMRLWVVNVSNGITARVTSTYHVVDFCWAPDSIRLAATIAPTSHLNDIVEGTKLIILAWKSGRVLQRLSTKVGGGFNLAWSPNGKKIAFPELTPKKIARRLALISPQGGKPRYLLDDYHGYPINRIEWHKSSNKLWVRAFEKTRVRLLCVDTSTGLFKRAANAVQNFWSFAVTPDGQTIVLTAETGKCPPNLVVLRPGQKPQPLSNMNPQLDRFRLGNVKEISWKSSKDGQIIYGVLVTPDDFQPGKPYPTVVEIHGGPQGMWWSGWLGTYLSRGQYLASNGYVVLLPNPRGSINYGIPFVEANYRDWGGGDYQDIQSGIDHLIARKITDPKRIGIGGTSYGGYLTAWATTRSQRFRAAIVDAGSTDLVTLNLTIDVAIPMRRYLGGDELRDRDFYRRRSPLTFINRCKTPTLVLHGEKDKRAPLYQGMAWHRGLKLLGVDTQMIIYPNEGHGITQRAHQIDIMKRARGWYDKYLKVPNQR